MCPTMNTSYQVLKFGDAYYVCHNAVWLAGDSPEGPWTYAETVPDEFAKIPPSSPAYNTTFVSVESSTAETVNYSYTSGYENAYVQNDTVVYGTGYAMSAASVWLVYDALYDDYWYRYPYYPYYPWPPTYGYGAWYDPNTGRYGEAVVGYGPYGAAGGAAVFNPETGVYARGQAMWDSDEYAGRGYAYNPNTNTSIARNRYIDFEDNEGWSNRVARRGDEWRYTESKWEDGRMRTEFESSRGTEGEIYRERDGDTLTSSGTVRYGDREATFETERQRDGDEITGSGSITGENRSADFESSFEDGQGRVTFEGSQGGSGNITRELEDGELTGSGSFTRDGKTIESDTTRTAEGVRRDFESSGGGSGTTLRQGSDRGFVYESGSGDLYAGRNGQVYQRTDDGWNKMENSRSSARETGAAANNQRLESSTIRATDSRYTNHATTQPRRSTVARQNTQLDRDFQSRRRCFERHSRARSADRFSSGGFNARRSRLRERRPTRYLG